MPTVPPTGTGRPPRVLPFPAHLTFEELERRFPEGTQDAGVRFEFDPDTDPDDVARASLPTAEHLAGEQEEAAVRRIHTGPSGTLQWRLPAVQHVAGPVKAGDLVLIAGRTGGGKSLFCQNVFDDFVTGGRVGLYIGTEQDDDVLATKWACARAGVSPRLILAPEPGEINSEDHRLAKDAVQRALHTIRSGDYAKRGILAKDARRLDPAMLRKWVRGGVKKYGLEFVIIDHVDRLNDAGTKNPWLEQSNMIVAAKELAVELDLVMFLASQVKRAGDRGLSLAAPCLDDLAGMATKEREADLALAVYRPVVPGLSQDTVKQVRDGLLDASALWMADTMAVKCLKHRLDNSRWGRVGLLDVQGARLAHRDDRHNHATTAVSR